MEIKFIGGTETVTGSNYLIHMNNKKFVVDFGLYQEINSYELNREVNFKPEALDFMILTHAHVDHSGRIPLLYREGFKKKIVTTEATKDLSEIMLEDSAKIQVSESEEGLIEPLYSIEEAQEVMGYFYPIDYNETFEEDDIKITFKNAGHILGSSSVKIENENKSVVFSGDIGSGNNLLLDQPQNFDYCDYLIIESTYGDSLHENPELRIKKLADILLKVKRNNEIALIPSFSVGRTQGLIYELKKLIKENDKYKELEKLDFYLDSPLGLKATEIYLNSRSFLRKDLNFNHDIFKMPNLKYITEFDETFKIMKDESPKVIISSSGMLSGGKILFYLERFLSNPKLNILFIGYQAEGTRGREILNRNKKIKIKDEIYDNNAKVYDIKGFSGHADQKQLLNWIDQLKEEPKKIFITHGEKNGREALKEILKRRYESEIILPNKNEIFKL